MDPADWFQKALQVREKKSLGRITSDLLAKALATPRSTRKQTVPRLAWVSRPMRARVKLEDKEARPAAMDSTRKPR